MPVELLIRSATCRIPFVSQLFIMLFLTLTRQKTKVSLLLFVDCWVYILRKILSMLHHHIYHIYLASHAVTSKLHTYTTDTTQTIQVHYALQGWHDNKSQ